MPRSVSTELLVGRHVRSHKCRQVRARQPCDPSGFDITTHVAGRPVAAQAKSASKAPTPKGEPAPPAENPTLAQTTKAPKQSPGRVDSGILEGGVSVALLDKKKDVEETGISTPEEFWTPLRPSPSNGAEFKDPYGELKPVPQHDGTECLKTDDSLWSHAEHFKVPKWTLDHQCFKTVLTDAYLSF